MRGAAGIRTRGGGFAIRSLRPKENAHSREGAAVGAENTPIDPNLQSIIDCWPGLPAHVKQTILTLAQSVPNADE